MYGSRRLRLKRSTWKQKLVLYGIMGLIGAVIFGFIAAFVLFAYYGRDLPAPNKLSQVTNSSTVFLDRDGKVLFDMYKDKNRMPVDYTAIADYLKKATVAVEDKNFYKHSGISETGILRAVLSIVTHNGTQGGSTITQQLIKNVLLDSRQTVSRKVKEWILAIEVERKYSKDQILGMYLNEAPYGGSLWGVGSASKGYFNKDPKDLDLAQSAVLAGLPQSPSRYSPFIGKNDLWRGRAKDVLRRMREDGYITAKQETDAGKELDAMKFTAPNLMINAPHFVFYAKDQIEQSLGAKVMDQGLRIKTTLSLDVQQTVEKIVKEEIGKLKDYHATNGAVVVLDSQTGEILAMVGSYDYNDPDFGNYNVAALGQRQPGSTIKPLTYALAFEKGYTPATVLMDVKTSFPVSGSKDYEPVNYDGKFRGPVQIRFALGNSLNIPAVKMVAMLGVRDFLQKADEMGLHTFAPTDENLKRFGLSITLGGGETTLLSMTNAFSVFARGGSYKDTQPIIGITDYKGKTIFKPAASQEKRVFSPESTFLISHILSDNNARMDEFGPNSYLKIPGKTVAVKTGTTDDKRDNWAIGYTKSLTVGVWVGNNDFTQMNQKIASGATGASPIWYRVMNELLKKYPDGIIDKPDKVVATNIDAWLGGLQHNADATRSEYFVKGTEPKDLSPFYKKVKISKSNGKLANDVEIKQGNYDEKEFVVFTENDPISVDGKNRWQEGIDAWLKDQGDPKFHPPGDKSDASSDAIIVSIKAPNNHDNVTTNDVEYRVKISSIASIKTVEVYFDNNKVKVFDGNNSEVSDKVHLQDGVHEMKVVARNDKDKTGDSTISFGVNKSWDSVTPTPSPTPKKD
ncbi:penicillin-binding protein [Candidatus Roizmanbacteria bacterium]|nr:penicillin-binding protein [Candidatus Roizmanbacteria bacterium]